MINKFIFTFIIVLFISNESKADFVSLEDFNSTYNSALEQLENDNQKVSIQFQLFNDSLIFSSELNSWRYNGKIYTSNNGSDYLYDGEYMLQIFNSKYEMFLFSSEQAQELIKKPNNTIDFNFINTDSIQKTESENSTLYTLYPKNQDSEIANTNIVINKLDGKLLSVEFMSNENVEKNISATRFEYLYQPISEKDFIWTMDDFITKDNEGFVPSKKYNNYQLISYIK